MSHYEILTKYNEQRRLELEREIAEKRGYEEGYKEGRKQALLLTLADLIENGLITSAQAAKKAKTTKKEFEAKVKALKDQTRSPQT